MDRERWAAVMFDLDGTLLDTRPGIRASLVHALREAAGLQTLPREPEWSQPIAALVERLLPDSAIGERGAVVASFRAHYDGGLWAEARLFPGAKACLEELCSTGLRCFLVTNKRQTATNRLLDCFGLARYFEAVVAQPDEGDPLPKTMLAGTCLADAGLVPGVVAVVGDSDHDATMAAAWGMTFIAITSGTGPLSGGPANAERVEVGSLSDAASFLVNRLRGGHREP